MSNGLKSLQTPPVRQQGKETPPKQEPNPTGKLAKAPGLPALSKVKQTAAMVELRDELVQAQKDADQEVAFYNQLEQYRAGKLAEIEADKNARIATQKQLLPMEVDQAIPFDALLLEFNLPALAAAS